MIIIQLNNKLQINKQSTMRLDPSYLHFISSEELRILAAIEMGMRNHQYVPAELIAKIGNLKNGQTYKTIRKLLKNKFINHIGNKCDGYKLTYLGYDYLALQTLMKRGVIKDVIGKIGVGKQSDIYKCITPDGEFVVLKLTRLGRNSFRSIKRNRDYIQHRTNYNWLYLSRLSSTRQFMFMQLLYQNNFPTPTPIDTNRHAIVMSLIDGDTFSHIQRISTQNQIKLLFQKSMQILVRFAKNGLIHGDYNQFNILVNADGNKLTVIDFPQCISVKHPNAQTYFYRDVECIYKYFDKMSIKSYEYNLKQQRAEGDMEKVLFKFNVSDYPMPIFKEIQIEKRLDHEIKNVGHITLQEYNQLEKYRTEEERMKAEMVPSEHEDQQEEDNSQQDQQNEKQEDQHEVAVDEEKFFNELDKQNNKVNNEGKEVNEIEFECIQAKNQMTKYDEQLQNLLNDLSMKPEQIKTQNNKNEQQESSSQQERFKGLTPYEIRIKLKEEKRIQREKKKQALNTDDFIKKALRKKQKKVKAIQNGNYGTKNKVKQNNQQIRDGFY